MLIIFDFIMDLYTEIHSAILASILVRMENCHSVFVYIVLGILHIIFVLVLMAAFAINLAVLALGTRMLLDWLKILYVNYLG